MELALCTSTLSFPGAVVVYPQHYSMQVIHIRFTSHLYIYDLLVFPICEAKKTVLLNRVRCILNIIERLSIHEEKWAPSKCYSSAATSKVLYTLANNMR